MSIEMDMFLILAGRDPNAPTKKLESPNGASPEALEWSPRPDFVATDKRLYLYLEPTQNSKDFKAVVYQKNYENPVFTDVIEYNQDDGKFYFQEPSDGEQNREAKMLVFNFLEKHNLLTYEYATASSDIKLSEEEMKLFGMPKSFDPKDLKLIGQGGFRNVYDMGNYVFKLANSYNSIDDAKQCNKFEATSKMHQEFPDLTVKTYKHAPDFSWVIQDKVIPVSDDDELRPFFKEINRFDYFEDFLKKIVKDLEKLSFEFMKLKYKPLTIRLALLIKKYNLADLTPYNFGLTQHGPVILDLAPQELLENIT